MQYFAYCNSPLGRVLLTASDSGLTGLHFVGEKYFPHIESFWREDERAPYIQHARAQLEQYFVGARSVFEVPLDPSGTPFQLKVWMKLREIAYAETISYGELAQRVGDPNAARAVGAANGRNPISIIVPCHRVIGADGSLTGYAGGMERKKSLLYLEKLHGDSLWRSVSIARQ
jgi:methylated-DNA-[protein]-cysteine S-methyltransferase